MGRVIDLGEGLLEDLLSSGLVSSRGKVQLSQNLVGHISTEDWASRSVEYSRGDRGFLLGLGGSSSRKRILEDNRGDGDLLLELEGGKGRMGRLGGSRG